MDPKSPRFELDLASPNGKFCRPILFLLSADGQRCAGAANCFRGNEFGIIPSRKLDTSSGRHNPARINSYIGRRNVNFGGYT
ncbi:MAG: hypothetical protein KF708_12280 [Pirellulales bacterium]|nr:hypothetical protein [Pirellulales bacterium]